VQFELVGGKNPAPLAPVPQSFGPPWRSYYLIGPPPRWHAGEDLAYLQDVWSYSVSFDRLTVNPPHVSGPAIVVGIGQSTGLSVSLGYARAVRDARQEVVTLLEGLDTDPVLLGQDTERGYEALVDNPSLHIAHSLWCCPEVGTLEKLAHLRATRPGILAFQGTAIPQSPPDAGWARRGGIHIFQTPASGEQERGTK
jgi:hypothetical protein